MPVAMSVEEPLTLLLQLQLLLGWQQWRACLHKQVLPLLLLLPLASHPNIIR